MAPNLGNAFSFLTIRGHRATILRSYFDFFSGAVGDPLDPRLDVLGVKYVVSPEPLEGLRQVMQEDDRYLYVNDDAFPIFHWYDPVRGQRTPAKIGEIDFHANSVTVSVEEPESGLLLFSQPFFLGWKATVDGRPRRIRQVDIFMAVELSLGEKQLAFLYRPWLLWLSLVGPLLVLVALGCSITLHRCEIT
jgi:hypothetical protein